MTPRLDLEDSGAAKRTTPAAELLADVLGRAAKGCPIGCGSARWEAVLHTMIWLRSRAPCRIDGRLIDMPHLKQAKLLMARIGS